MMEDILHPQYNFFHLFIFVWATGAQSHLYNPLLEVLDSKIILHWDFRGKNDVGCVCGVTTKICAIE